MNPLTGVVTYIESKTHATDLGKTHCIASLETLNFEFET